MYLGRVVEIAVTEDIFDAPNHPYTQALLSEVPRLDLRKRRYHPVKGEIPSPLDPPSGCHFHPRCPHATARCRVERPPLPDIPDGRWSSCPPPNCTWPGTTKSNHSIPGGLISTPPPAPGRPCTPIPLN